MAMHPNAENALRARFKKVIEKADISAGNLAKTLDWTELNPLAEQLAKLKSEFITSSDAVSLIYDYVYSLIPPENQISAPLTDLILSKEEVTENFIQLINEIPFKIKVSFPLPRLAVGLFNGARVSETEWFEIKKLKNKTSNIMEDCVYFTTIVEGYWGDSFDSPTPRESLARLKISIQFLFSDDVVMPTRHSVAGIVFEEPASQMDALVEYTVLGRPVSTKTELPQTINEFAYFLRRSPKNFFEQTRKTDQFKERLEPSLLRLSRFLSTTNPHSKRVKAAAEWHIDALANHSDTMALIQSCIALESLYGDDSSNGGLTETLADRCAYSLATTHAERAKIKAEFKEIYRLRSKIVHGVVNNLKPEETSHLRHAKRLLIASIKKESGLL
ncbi:hypothetical protein [Pseudomonas sp. USHLN015]|uniref:hypothetical protein n=1 Tax=Pseudomonas sp. USHLN015 TaxID=3081296 RepID=UPI00301DCFEE